jgi:hypothetical protein
MICIQLIFACSAKAEVPDIDVNKLISPRDLRMKQEVGKQKNVSPFVSYFCYTVLQYYVLPDLLHVGTDFCSSYILGFFWISAH